MTLGPKKNRLTALTVFAGEVSVAAVLPSRPLGIGLCLGPSAEAKSGAAIQTEERLLMS
jgi:hypothetical protein